ncbi:MAG: penicillin acylase family protein, partial [Deltaproteobacteria bacterium]|nr:penicillin acylase family protein [Deltaproteobacteria bacterium]
MKNRIKVSLYFTMILALVMVSGCAKTISPEQFQDLPYKYNVSIMRDTWGVPHIFGESDPDVAFGLAYAHAEDDYQTIEGTLLAARGKLASVYGPKAAPNDYMVHLLRVWDVVNARYETDLSPETKALCDAYADGLNYYASLHPRQVHAGLYPARGID